MHKIYYAFEINMKKILGENLPFLSEKTKRFVTKCNFAGGLMESAGKSGFEPPEFDSLRLVNIDFSEWRPYLAGLHAMDVLAKTRGEYVEVTDLKDKRSGPVVSVRVTNQGHEIDDDTDYEAVFEKSVSLKRGAVIEAEVGVEQFVIALDLEGTLISNGMSQFPRPGLRDFLEALGSLEVEVVVYSTLSTNVVDEVLVNLSNDGAVPLWFMECRRVPWQGGCKSIRDVRVSGDSSIVMLVDDYEGYVCPGEEDYWIEVPTFSSPYQESSIVLRSVLQKIESVLSGLRKV
jgi:hypothetical protein